MASITINGKKYEVDDNITVLEACRKMGIDIPTLCYDDRLEPHAACRLCLVEVKGKGKLETSCSLKVKDGMVIETHSERVMKTRKEILNLIIFKPSK